MNKNQYIERRANLVNRMINASEHHCWRTARARKRDIIKLDEEWQASMK